MNSNKSITDKIAEECFQTSNYCKGCSANTMVSLCDFVDFHGENDGMCPCTNCLVKMMCDTCCEAYRHLSPANYEESDLLPNKG